MIRKSFAAAVTIAVLFSAHLLSVEGSDGAGVAVAAHPTITPGSSTRAWGDSDCDGDVTQRDFKSVQRVILSEAPLSQMEACPTWGRRHMSAPFDKMSYGVDWNRDEALDVVDVLAVHRTVAGQPPLQFGESCPIVGEQASVTELQSASRGEATTVVEGSATYFAVQVYLATQGLGALDLTISYDPLLVTIQNCIPSDITIECNAHFADGEVRLLATYPLGSVADTRLAEIDLESSPGGHLTWGANKATSPNASPTAAAIQMIPYNLDPPGTASPTPFSTASPTPTQTPTPTPAPSGSSTFVPTPTGRLQVQRGNADCYGGIQTYDVIRILSLVVNLPLIHMFHCQPSNVLIAADLDCDEQITPKDAIVLARYLGGLTATPLPSGCEPIGTFVLVS